MKQVVIYKGEVQVEEVPAPLIQDGHVLVGVTYSLISTGTEMGVLSQARKSLPTKLINQPQKVIRLRQYLRQQGVRRTMAIVRDKLEEKLPLGYSCSGLVIAVGNGVNGLKPGDRVACAGTGYANHAEVVSVPKNLVVKVPMGCSLKHAASVALGSIALQGVRRADVRLGENVAVVGLGLIGQITLQFLKLAGCRVVGIELENHRLDIAKVLGCDLLVNPIEMDVIGLINQFTDGYGVDATIITAASGSDKLVQQAMEITRKKGKVIVVGAVGMNLQRSPFYEKEIDFLISCSYGPGRYDPRYEDKSLDYPFAYVRWTENRNMQEYLRLIAEGKIRLDSILQQEFNVEDATKAYQALRSFPRPLGILLRYSDIEKNNQKQETKTQLLHTHRRDSPSNNKIKIALIGAGHFAKNVHLPNLKQLSHLYCIHAIVSATGLNAVGVAQKYKATYATTNYEDVLNDSEIDAVLICTRHHLHAQQAIQAAKAHKAIFLEKPMALNELELDKLVLALRETSVPFMVGFNRRFSPAVQKISEIISARQDPLMILYRVNAGYLSPDHWTQNEEGGGRIVGEMCHFFDLFRYLIGYPVVKIEVMPIVPRREGVLFDDNLSVTLRYQDGSVATLFYTALGSEKLPKEYLEIYADQKVILLHDFQRLEIYGGNSKGWKSNRQDKGHLRQLELFADYYRGNTDAPIPLGELIEAMQTSFKIQNLCFTSTVRETK